MDLDPRVSGCKALGNRRSSACTDVWGLVLGSLVDRVMSRGDYVLRGS